MQQPNLSFFGLGIAPKILEILEKMKFVSPTPIQHAAIPPGLEGKDIIGIAQTGTGKTVAFGIPMVQRLSQTPGKALVLVPTRELAFQVEQTLQKIAHPFQMKTAVLIGGASMHLQIQNLRRNPRIIIATPGRLMDHLEQRTTHLNDTKILVIDEADRMFDMGFAPQVERILKNVPKDRQTLLFSATMPDGVVGLMTRHMKIPLRVEIAPAGTTVDNVTQELFVIRRDAKEKLLGKILEQYHGSVLLFVQTKIYARRISRVIREQGHRAAEIHSDRSMAQRKEALEGFKAGRYRILVATDIASRGIDVKGIELVINYDLPEDAENYVHRIGRTGRAGHPGHAISFATPDQWDDVKKIERMTRKELPVSEHPLLPSEKFFAPLVAPPKRGFSSGRRSFGGSRRFGRRR